MKLTTRGLLGARQQASHSNSEEAEAQASRPIDRSHSYNRYYFQGCEDPPQKNKKTHMTPPHIREEN
jgi:hypothetical protein